MEMILIDAIPALALVAVVMLLFYKIIETDSSEEEVDDFFESVKEDEDETGHKS